MEWNGDVVQVMAEDDDLSYLVPEEGAVVWMDNMCVPKDAPNPKTPTLSSIMCWTRKSGRDRQHHPLRQPQRRRQTLAVDRGFEQPAVYPPDSVIARCEAVIDVGDAARLYDEAWTKIKPVKAAAGRRAAARG